MAKSKVVITHEEYGEFDLGDVPEALFAEAIQENDSGYTLGDMGSDWKVVKVQIDGKDYPAKK
jgi:hypothetical protein